jgi:hypothetical protein
MSVSFSRKQDPRRRNHGGGFVFITNSLWQEASITGEAFRITSKAFDGWKKTSWRNRRLVRF